MFYLDEDFRIVELDVRNVMMEGRILKEGEERSDDDSWRFEGYFSSIGSLLKTYLQRSLNKSGAKQAEELLAEIKRVERIVEEKSNEAAKVMAKYMVEADRKSK